jgi:hypothetical protein
MRNTTTVVTVRRRRMPRTLRRLAVKSRKIVVRTRGPRRSRVRLRRVTI